MLIIKFVNKLVVLKNKRMKLSQKPYATKDLSNAFVQVRQSSSMHLVAYKYSIPPTALHDHPSGKSTKVNKNSGRDSWSGGHQWVKESHKTSPHRGQTQEFPRSSMHGSTKRWMSSWVQALTCPILLLHNACEIVMRAFLTSVSAITGKTCNKSGQRLAELFLQAVAHLTELY